MDLLRLIFFPTAKTSSGNASSSLSFEGLPDIAALLLLLGLAGLCWWAHARMLPHVAPWRRRLVSSLRIIFFAGLVFALMRPVIVTTLVEDVRQKLIVLVDDSKSMALADNRATPEDRQRALIATGSLDPDHKLTSSATKETPPLARSALLAALAENSKLDLWKRLGERSDLAFYRFGADAADATPAEADPAKSALSFFNSANPSQPVTALGDSLRQVLAANRGQPIAGVLVITDGASNRGLHPAEAAAQARQDGVPLLIYGVGVTEPRDIVLRSLDAPRLGFLNERIAVRARLGANGYEGQSVRVELRDSATGPLLASQDVALPAKGSLEVNLSFTANKAGEFVLEAFVPPQPGEASADNNKVSAKIRILDQRIKVFMIEQEPRWDYRHLLDFLQDDRRLALRAVLLDGDPSLQAMPGSVFLPGLPDNREELYKSDILLLGDVDPGRLGTERMRLIRDWVDQGGGGLVFLCGQKFAPYSYVGTPLEALLPIIPPRIAPQSQPINTPPPSIRLTPSAAGRRSPILRLADNETASLKIWNTLPPVKWVAEGVRPRAGAEILLETEAAIRGQPGTPVLARQRFGRGQVMYLGFEETYRWRSKLGQKYYASIWGQLFQALSLDRLEGASKQVQLRLERNDYELGERVVITGKLYQANFAPLIADLVPGEITGPPAADGSASPPIAVSLSPVPQEPGSYRLEFTPTRAGQYALTTALDPKSPVEFQIEEARLEQTETALNLDMLEAMAKASGGELFREEDLHRLPERLKETSGKVTSIRRLELFASPVLMGILFLLLGAEWIVRRLSRLK